MSITQLKENVFDKLKQTLIAQCVYEKMSLKGKLTSQTSALF